MASGILHLLIFPKFAVASLSWVALAPMLIAVFREDRCQRAFLLGIVCGLAFFSGCCYWILIVLQGYGALHWTGAVLLFALLVIYLSTFPGLFAWAFAKVSRRFPGACFLLAPFLWVSTEYMRGHVLTGFPWCLTGYALVDYANLAQTATITGVYGLSFLAVWISALVTRVFFLRSWPSLSWLLIAAATLIGLAWVEFNQPTGAEIEEASARLVQTNIDLHQPWDPRSKSLILKQLTDLSLSAEDSLSTDRLEPRASASVELVIWPETPAPFYYHHDPMFQRTMQDLATASGAPVLFGFVDFRPASFGSGASPYNSVATLSSQGKLIAQYDKMHLVPFGEYVPLSWLFFFAEKISTEVGNFEPGRRVVISELASGNKVGTFICYEAVVPDLVRRFVARGAEVLVNVTNDAWFGDSAAPYQHLMMARMRAIENRRYLLRAANSGISAAIDPFGRVTASTNLYERKVLNVPFSFRQASTFYSRFGDVFAFICLGVSALSVVLSHQRRSSTRR